jgi:hypothetical protein
MTTFPSISASSQRPAVAKITLLVSSVSSDPQLPLNGGLVFRRSQIGVEVMASNEQRGGKDKDVGQWGGASRTKYWVVSDGAASPKAGN